MKKMAGGLDHILQKRLQTLDMGGGGEIIKKI